MSSPVNWGSLMEAAKKQPSFDPLPEGDYLVRITECEPKTTKAGEVMFSYKVVVSEGTYARRTMYGNLVIPSPTANKYETRAFFFVRDLRALGFGDEYISSQPQPADLARALVGRTFVASVTVETYEGKTRNNLKRINAYTGVAPAAPAASAPASTPAPTPPAPPVSPAPAPAAAATPPPSLPPSPFDS